MKRFLRSSYVFTEVIMIRSLLILSATVITFGLGATPRVRAETNFGQVAMHVAYMLQNHHYSRRDFDDKVSDQMLSNFLDLLDFRHVFFTQEDVDGFRAKYATTLDDHILMRNVAPAQEIYDVYVERVKNRVEFARKVLETEEFSFKTDATVELKRDKAPWPKNLGESDQLWRKLLEENLLSETLIAENREREKLKKAAEKKEKEKDSKPSEAAPEPTKTEPAVDKATDKNAAVAKATEDDSDDEKLTPKQRVMKDYDRLLETTWHQTQSITTDPDDYITFTVQVAEPEEMIPWIRSWGSGVVVLEPESLRQRMIATLQRQLQAYGLPAGEVSRKSRRACLWAKYDRQSEFYHRLEYHLLDVAAVAWQMWERALSPAWRHRVATLLGLDHEAARCLIALLAGLHDIGKATPEFQRKAPPLYEALLAAGLPDRHEGDVAHGILSAVIINSLLLAKPGVDERAGQVVSAAVGGHHGEFVDFKQFRMRRSTLLREGWSEIHTELCNMLERVLQVTAFRFPEEPAEYNVFAGWLAGFVSVCDWIGSQDGYFPYETLDIDENRYFARALGQAELALTEMGWFGWSKPHDLPDFQTLFPFPPNLFQQTALEFCVDTAAPAAPRLVLIEYLTGGGKTELALYLADWLANAFDQAGTYIAMPTRATSNQMFERVSQYLQTRYPHQPINVQLIHAQADQHPLYQQLLPRPEREGDDNRLKAESWFQNRRRALLAPFAVGTIDQAMLGVLPVQHYFVRQFALTHKTVIFDEIHAYDTYMNVIIERLLQWLNALSSSVILLSATLPAATRQRLIEQAAPGQTLPVVPYPRLTLVDQAGHVRVHRLPAPPPRELALAYLDPQVAALVELLLPIYQAGGCIAVICNTVDEAVQVAYVLQQHAAISAQDLLVFHARFPAAWRAPIEQEVLRRFSKHGERPARAILVATQIVEQSLDLDFDLMVTRVAPMDLLIQRAGRLHRHAGRSRPEHLQQPALVIRMPDFDEAQVPLFGVDEVVYQRLILLKTWLALHDRDRLRLPEDIDTLMEAVYGEDDIPNLTAPWAAALKTAHETMKLSETRSGFRASQKCISTPDDEMALWNTAAAFRDDEADVVTTRDMLPGVDILCLGTAGNRQGLPTLPAHRPAREETAHLLRFVLTVHKAGVREALVKLPVPDGWQRIPQLQHVRPVTFVDGLYHIAGTSWTLRLTRTYGLEIVEDRD
ncbi:MAG: CRISPR-associated helicase Cas3' [Anaerolineae bacterium]|nr:CRISPR-associated helicase Cas3' [Anaerolineae bacterium]